MQEHHNSSLPIESTNKTTTAMHAVTTTTNMSACLILAVRRWDRVSIMNSYRMLTKLREGDYRLERLRSASSPWFKRFLEIAKLVMRAKEELYGRALPNHEALPEAPIFLLHFDRRQATKGSPQNP